MKYYRVLAKCGHVRRNNYILKNFYLKAFTAKEAAFVVRYLPRVKHDKKDAIKNVEEISFEEYEAGRLENNLDPYFKVKNSSEQRLFCQFEEGEILREDIIEYKNKRRNRRTKPYGHEWISHCLLKRSYEYYYE